MFRYILLFSSYKATGSPYQREKRDIVLVLTIVTPQFLRWAHHADVAFGKLLGFPRGCSLATARLPCMQFLHPRPRWNDNGFHPRLISSFSKASFRALSSHIERNLRKLSQLSRQLLLVFKTLVVCIG